jgi:hypothetical protein
VDEEVALRVEDQDVYSAMRQTFAPHDGTRDSRDDPTVGIHDIDEFVGGISWGHTSYVLPSLWRSVYRQKRQGDRDRCIASCGAWEPGGKNQKDEKELKLGKEVTEETDQTFGPGNLRDAGRREEARSS